jgi:hypothetical protein
VRALVRPVTGSRSKTDEGAALRHQMRGMDISDWEQLLVGAFALPLDFWLELNPSSE